MKIMFICTGNICRSAMAEAMMKEMLAKKQKENIEVYSAGIYAGTGDVPTQTAVEVMKESYGIDLSHHRATNIKESQIEKMDLILCATISHKIEILQDYPQLQNKVYTLKEYAGLAREGRNFDISDPWGYDKKVYENCAKEIEECLEKILGKIEKQMF